MDASAVNHKVPVSDNQFPSGSISNDYNKNPSDKSNKSSDELEEIFKEPISSRRSTRKIMPRI